MKDWIGLLIAFVVGFFMKILLGTLCGNRLIEGDEGGGGECSYGNIDPSWKKFINRNYFCNLDNDVQANFIKEITSNNNDYDNDYAKCIHLMWSPLKFRIEGDDSFYNSECDNVLKEHQNNIDEQANQKSVENSNKCKKAVEAYCIQQYIPGLHKSRNYKDLKNCNFCVDVIAPRQIPSCKQYLSEESNKESLKQELCS